MYYQQCCQKLPLSQHRARRSQASGARSDGLAWGTGYPASSVRRAAKAGTARSAALQPRAPPGGQQPRRGRLGARGPLGRRPRRRRRPSGPSAAAAAGLPSRGDPAELWARRRGLETESGPVPGPRGRQAGLPSPGRPRRPVHLPGSGNCVAKGLV